MSYTKQAYDVHVYDETVPGGVETYTIVPNWKDRLKAEQETVALALNQPGLVQHQATVLFWATMVRLGLYEGDFWSFVELVADVDKVKDVPADPTQPAASTDSVSPSPSTTPAPATPSGSTPSTPTTV